MDAFDTRAAIGRFLFVCDPPESVDLAFVVGSPTVSSLAPAASLFKTGLTSRILISGAGRSVGGMPEWQLYRDEALSLGIPAEALLLETRARNTFENFAFGAALIEATLGWACIRSVAVCAKPFHMRRAIMTARRHFPAETRLIARPPACPGDLSRETWWHSEAGRRRVLEEFGKIGQYALKGDLADV